MKVTWDTRKGFTEQLTTECEQFAVTALRDTRMTSWYRGMWFLDRLRGVV